MEVSLKVVNPLKTSVMAMKHLVQNNNNGDENPPKGVCRDIKLLIKHVDTMERARDAAMDLLLKQCTK